MSKLTTKQANSLQRANRVRTAVTGTTQRPRLSVHVSNLHVSVQIINDETHQTLAAVSTVGQKISGTMTEKATWAGTEIAKKAKTVKVTKVVFDRGSKLYHGRVQALADAARKEGLEF
ncbi:MAG TPA: 50S ribosomal protein L18 [Candidatus Microsaccharimonas sp.]|nr:50S ribosomal protein L18 [Candidatus Microsaccharimonas sp.]